MKARRAGLGRGLDALIPGAGALDAPPVGVARVPLDEIRANPDQPRRTFDDAELAALADSIRRHGILQPLVVVRESEGFRLVAGERRLRAAKLAGLTDVPVVVREDPSASHSLALSLIENIQRNDLNPFEEADAFRRLVEEFSLTHEEAAREVGRTRTYVTNSMRLLTVSPAVKSALLSSAITAGHARAVAGLSHTAQDEVLRTILKEGLTVRDTESIVQRAAENTAATMRRRPGARAEDPETRALAEELQRTLQARVRLIRSARGKGRVVIEFGSDDELGQLVQKIRKLDVPRGT